MRELTIDYLRAVCKRKGDCWIWPGRRDEFGAPRAGINGKRGVPVRRHVLKLLKKLPEGHSTLVAICTCDEPGCVNPAHLKAIEKSVQAKINGLKTRPKVETLRRHAAERGWSKLDLEAARRVRAAVEGLEGYRRAEAVKAMAAEYGMTASAIRRVVTGATWAEPANSVFSWRPKEAA